MALYALAPYSSKVRLLRIVSQDVRRGIYGKLRSNQKSKVAKPWSAIAIYFRFVGGLGVTKTILYQMHECHQFEYSCKNVIYTPTW